MNSTQTTYQQQYAKRARELRAHLKHGGVGTTKFNHVGAFMVALCAKACERDATSAGKLTPIRAVLR